jgi:septation ring formation regulator EzrA
MGRKRRSDSIQSIEEEKELLMEDEPVNDKIKRVSLQNLSTRQSIIFFSRF